MGRDPSQGCVLEWRRHSYRWTALVLTSSPGGQGRPASTSQWVPAER